MGGSETAVDKSRKLLGVLFDYTEKMPRGIKFTVGDRLISNGLDVMENIVEAYYSGGRIKIEKLDRANVKLEVLRQLLRYLFERNNHNLKKHEYLSGEIDAVGVCVGAWRKQVRGDKS